VLEILNYLVYGLYHEIGAVNLDEVATVVGDNQFSFRTSLREIGNT
jgi:hypothetical protein